MKLFFYYAFHTTVNQIRKLMKTWVLIFFLCCGLLGGIIGYGAASIENMAEENTGEEEILPEAAEEEHDSVLRKIDLGSEERFELIFSVGMLILFAYDALSADRNGGKIFQSSDVNLLFASPLQPQSVLLFRLLTQMGTAVFMVFYLLLQLPNLTLNMGMSLPAALGLIVAFCAAALTGKLLQVLLYTLSSTRPRLRRQLRFWVYAAIAAVAGGYILFHLSSGLTPWQSAAKFFNAPLTRFIPLWGFLRGFLRAMVEGRWLPALLFLLALFAAQGILVYIIWHIPADFYEDAMAKSEETAEARRRAQSEQTSVAMGKRRKDRSDSLLRDGLRHGWGSSVFFYKNMYNRRRFAHFGFLTKTIETYLVTVLAVFLLCNTVFKTDPFLPMVLTLAGFAYFRAMGNPLETDTQMDFFLLIPESLWKKLFFSLLSAAADCLLDVALPLLLAAALGGGHFAEALGWLPFIVSINFYATTVGAFINLSVPVSAGKTVKSIVQVMFVYFGLLPDMGIMAVGLVTGHTALAAILSAAVNILLGLVFFALTPLFLDPPCRPAPMAYDYAGDLREARREFSRAGWALAVILGGGSALQLGLISLLDRFVSGWTEAPYALWAVTFAPLYLIAFPAGILLLRSVPARAGKRGPVSVRDGAAAVLVSVFFMYAGNILGSLATALLNLLPGVESGNPLTAYAAEESLAVKCLFFVILAPILEEIVFRKMLIDRLRIHGEKLAVLLSGLLFGLFHGNLSQFFYAAALGLVFGYVYLRTSRLWCPVGLHMFINFLGGIVAPWVLGRMDGDGPAFDGGMGLRELLFSPTGLYALYVILLLAAATGGMVVFFLRRRQLRFAGDEYTLPRGRRLATVAGNSGMAAFLLCVLAVMAISLF